jgi:hypothetical protein
MTILQQLGAGISTPGSDSTTTVRDIAACVSLDVRKVVDPNNPNVGASDTNILIDYTNRISLDLLRHSRYTFLIAGPVGFNTVATPQGVTPFNNQYWVGLTGAAPVGTIDTGLDLSDFDSIKRDTVIDYSNFKRLAVSELQPVSQEFTLPAKPRIWQVLSDVPNVITLWPPPDGSYNIQFRYYQTRNILTNLGQTIQVPDRYKDIVCHGVTWLTYQYLKSYPEDVLAYKELYMSGKTQIIKDMNLFPRGEEFVRPDPSAVTRQTTTGIGLDSGLETSIP